MNATRVPVAPSAALQISILHVPNCPSIGRVRDAVEVALARVGATAVIEEIEGDYPSPTLLIDGVEIDGYPLRVDPACRINLPTDEEIATAMRAALVRRSELTPPKAGST